MKRVAVGVLLSITTLLVWALSLAGSMVLINKTITCAPGVLCDSPGIAVLGLLIATVSAGVYWWYTSRLFRRLFRTGAT